MAAETAICTAATRLLTHAPPFLSFPYQAAMSVYKRVYLEARAECRAETEMANAAAPLLAHAPFFSLLLGNRDSSELDWDLRKVSHMQRIPQNRTAVSGLGRVVACAATTTTGPGSIPSRGTLSARRATRLRRAQHARCHSCEFYKQRTQLCTWARSRERDTIT